MELLALAAVVIAIVALVNAQSARHRLDHLERAVRDMSNRLNNTGAVQRGDIPTPAQAPPPKAEPLPIYRPQPSYQPPPPLHQPLAPQSQPVASAKAAPQTAPAPAKNLEETLTSRWLVWVGAVTIALAGTFLVRYAIDEGYLGPAARVTLGFLLGLTLALAGEWLRRRPMARAVAAIRVDQVPPALTASGVFIAFASIYAAYALYHLLPPPIAFAALALIALIAIGLSLVHGRLVAGLGLLGAFAAPALVRSDHPSVWVLFAYVLVVQAACLAVARYRQWWWLASAALAGAIFWVFAWILDGHGADGLPLGLFLLAGTVFHLALRRGLPEPEGRENWVEEILHFDLGRLIVWLGTIATAATMFVVVRTADYSPTVLVLAGLMMALDIAAGRRRATLDSLPVAGALLAVLIAARMPLPNAIMPHAPLHGTIAPFELQYFALTTALYGALFAVSGFALLWGAKRPALWAALSAATPLALLVVAYGRVAQFGVDLGWAAIALGLAAASLAAAERVARYRTAKGMDVALGVYAASVVALISLAAAMSVREAWLTVALSLQLPALGWVHALLRNRWLQAIAAAVGLTVLVRLACNYYVFDYPIGPGFSSNWLLYGYGVPMLAFFVASRLFRDASATRLVTLLEAGALAFGVLLTSLEIRLFVTGAITTPDYDLVEQSIQSIAWFSIGTALALHWRRSGNKVALAWAAALIGLAAAQTAFLQLLICNPLWTEVNVGRFPLVNVLFLAYATPAAFAFFAARVVEDTRFASFARPVAGAGFVLVFVWLSLEVTRAFEGPVFHPASHSDAELYTYSLLWLGYAVALLVLGIVRRQSFLRYASLAVLIVTTLKVFLIDMAGLTGLYRVGSFLGLGLSLIGIGYVYQRFVFPRTAPPR